MRPIDAVQALKDINWHHKPTPVSEFESGFNQGLNQAMWIITQASTLTPPNEWVSVEERLPDALTMVLIYSGGIYDVAGWIEDEDGKICWTHNAKPQFWRPIPGLEPPGKDNNVPTKEQNDPLTLEQLREMDEPTPVWWEKAGYWCLCERGFITAPNGNIYEFEETDGAFYRRPPEGEEAWKDETD